MHAFHIFVPRRTDWTKLNKLTTTGTCHVTHQHALEARNFCKDPYCTSHR
jgi:hypothetical protein